MAEKNVRKNVLKGIGPKGVYLISTKPENYDAAKLSLLRYLTSGLKLNGLYITLGTPFKTLIKELKSNNIDSSRLYFIDSITQRGSVGTITKNCTFVSARDSLTEMSIAIAEPLHSGGYDFILLDSVEHLLKSSDEETAAQFLHYLSSKLRLLDVSGYLISVEKDWAKKTISVFLSFCDKRIRV